MRGFYHLPTLMVVAAVAVLTTTVATPCSAQANGVRLAAQTFVMATTDSTPIVPIAFDQAAIAIGALSLHVKASSHPEALGTAVRVYYAFKAAYPDEVQNPYFYFVDFGLPSTQPRGYVFDMRSFALLDGPFTVAHGRGSSDSAFGVPARFSNEVNSAATSLGLYQAQETYEFRGRAGGRWYKSLGLRLNGLSPKYNDNARTRHVVAHGAPYVTRDKAALSEGCPAIENVRAMRLLPILANGGLVFLFAPDADWMAHDAWISPDEAIVSRNGRASTDSVPPAASRPRSGRR